LKDRCNGEKGVEHHDGRSLMASGKRQGHVHQPPGQAVALGVILLILSHVGKALMQAGIKGETKGL
jgi:hypothetical protein